MGLLFGKPKPPPEGPPPGADLRHSYAGNVLSPGEQYPELGAHYNGVDGWAPSYRLGYEAVTQRPGTVAFPIPQMDQPTDNPNPNTKADPYSYQRHVEQFNQAAHDEEWQRGGTNGMDAWPVTQESQTEKAAETPYLHPSLIDRVSARPSRLQSPSTMRFLHVTRSGRGDIPHLNGTHFSMASMHRNYPIRGMQPARRFRNTWRLEPPPRDAQQRDVSANAVPTVNAAEYQSPDIPAPGPGRNWRL